MIVSTPIWFDFVLPEIIIVVERTIRDSPVEDVRQPFVNTPHKVVVVELCLPWWLPFGLFGDIKWVSY